MTFRKQVHAFERHLLRTALVKSHGNKSLAARRLGMHHSHFSRLLETRNVSQIPVEEDHADEDDAPPLMFALLVESPRERPYAVRIVPCWTAEELHEAVADRTLVALVAQYDRAERLAATMNNAFQISRCRQLRLLQQKVVAMETVKRRVPA